MFEMLAYEHGLGLETLSPFIDSVNSPAAGAGDNLVVISGLDPPPAAEDLLGFSFVVNK